MDPPSGSPPFSILRRAVSFCKFRRSGRLDIEMLCFGRMLHDEGEASRRDLSHELGDDAVGAKGVVDGDFLEPAGFGIEGGLPQHLRHHLTETFEAGDLDLPALGVLLKYVFAHRIVRRPKRFLPDIDAVKRGLGDEDPPVRR